MEFWQSHFAYFVACLAFVGALIGSFINVIAYRLPIMLAREWRTQAREVLSLSPEANTTFNLLLPNSSCPHCSHPIKPWENIPVVSWLFLRGRCANCQGKISLRYPLVELGCAIISGFVAWHFGLTLQTAAFLLLTWGLLAMSLIDAEHQLLPDSLVLPLLWLGLIVNSQGLFVSLNDALWGAVAGYLSLWSVYWLFKLITGKEGMGYGDFKLLAMLGAWGGWQILPLTILLSSLVGAVLGWVILKLSRKEAGSPIAFGPFLAIAGWVALVFGDEITSRYFQLAQF